MGWISDRRMTRGPVGGDAEKTRETCRHPLRVIVRVTLRSENLFAPNHVEFECGHKGTAWGDIRGRCRECPQVQIAPPRT